MTTSTDLVVAIVGTGIRDRGGLEVSGIASGFAPIERATTDLAEAVDGATLIAVTTRNNDHQAVAAALAPLARRAGLPASDGPAVAELVLRVLPPSVPAANVFQTGLATMNPVLHVPGMLGNLGRLDAGERFQFYGAGITPSVARVIDAVDGERVAVARALGADVPTVRGWLARTYGLEGDDLYALIQRLHAEIFKDSPAPSALDTGGAGGIGSATVRRFVEEGARVDIADVDVVPAGKLLCRVSLPLTRSACASHRAA